MLASTEERVQGIYRHGLDPLPMSPETHGHKTVPEGSVSGPKDLTPSLGLTQHSKTLLPGGGSISPFL